MWHSIMQEAVAVVLIHAAAIHFWTQMLTTIFAVNRLPETWFLFELFIVSVILSLSYYLWYGTSTLRVLWCLANLYEGTNMSHPQFTFIHLHMALEEVTQLNTEFLCEVSCPFMPTNCKPRTFPSANIGMPIHLFKPTEHSYWRIR